MNRRGVNLATIDPSLTSRLFQQHPQIATFAKSARPVILETPSCPFAAIHDKRREGPEARQ